MCNGSLLPDVIHDVLEGTLQYEAKLMLNYMIFTEEYFTVDHLNSRISNLELGHMEAKDHLSLITRNNLRTSGHYLKQKGTLNMPMQCMHSTSCFYIPCMHDYTYSIHVVRIVLQYYKCNKKLGIFNYSRSILIKSPDTS